MKCPKCGEDLGLNNICINPMCINFGNEIMSSQIQNLEINSQSTDTSLNNSSNYANKNTNSGNFDNNINTSFNKNNINVNQNINNNAYISDEEFEAFLDNKNSNYYLRYLNQYRSNNKFTSWNWSAFLLTFYWLLYRKLYGVAALLFIGNFVIPFISFPVSLILHILLGVFANCIYLRSCEQKIKHIKAFCRNSSSEDYMKMLSIKGGVNLVAPIIFAVLLVALIIILAIVFAFFIFSSTSSSTTHSFYYYY